MNDDELIEAMRKFTSYLAANNCPVVVGSFTVQRDGKWHTVTCGSRDSIARALAITLLTSDGYKVTHPEDLK